MDGYTLGTIFARGGSKGVHRKNIRLISGKPLIGYAIEAALSSSLIDKVIVSTDDEEIASIATSYGAEVPFLRPSELADDDSPEWLSWRHAIEEMMKFDSAIEAFVCIPTTSPFRKVSDIDKVIRTLTQSSCDLVLTISPSRRNPYRNMVLMDDKNNVQVVIPSSEPISIFGRQFAPPVYDVSTVAYAARPEFILRSDSMFDGNVKAIVVSEKSAFDIDTELDLQIANLLMELSE